MPLAHGGMAKILSAAYAVKKLPILIPLGTGGCRMMVGVAGYSDEVIWNRNGQTLF